MVVCLILCEQGVNTIWNRLTAFNLRNLANTRFNLDKVSTVKIKIYCFYKKLFPETTATKLT